MKVPLADEVRAARAAAVAAQDAVLELARVDARLAALDVTDPGAAERPSLVEARGRLAPVAAEVGPAITRLNTLRDEQHHVLHAPEHAALAAELDGLFAERERVSRRLEPLQRRLAVLEPTLANLARALPTAGPDLLAAWAAELRALLALVGIEREVPADGQGLTSLAAEVEALRPEVAALADELARLDAHLLERMG